MKSSTLDLPDKMEQRFAFGDNWARFLHDIDAHRIAEAKKSLQEMLGVDDLEGKRFLDVGSGSGLFSLAARALGASVYSFDFDPRSVQCTQLLKDRYFPKDAQWEIASGSVLDRDYLLSLGKFDIVYSWGVLHHTGQMWDALDKVMLPLANGGKLYIAIYNDQGALSSFWRGVKRFYCSGLFGRTIAVMVFFPCFILAGLALDLVQLKNPMDRYLHYRQMRGMSVLTDWIDWLGGYPFEVAKPEKIFDFYRNKGLTLERIKTRGWRLGCNEYLFSKPE